MQSFKDFILTWSWEKEKLLEKTPHFTVQMLSGYSCQNSCTENTVIHPTIIIYGPPLYIWVGGSPGGTWFLNFSPSSFFHPRVCTFMCTRLCTCLAVCVEVRMMFSLIILQLAFGLLLNTELTDSATFLAGKPQGSAHLSLEGTGITGMLCHA